MKSLLPLVLVLGLIGIGAFFAFNNPSSSSAVPPIADLSFAEAPREPWAHEQSDIPAQERATFGSLDNGFRYVLVPNSEPPKRVSLRLHIDAGSLHEADDQRGVAHFLEHMVFNGSQNFPDPKALIPQMQRLGIAFGAHANAYTSFDETVYMLDLPNLAEQTLDLAYTVMRDFADGALLKAEEIDKERGVILSEKNSRDSVDLRLMKQQFNFLMPDSLITQRFPIGVEEVIASAQQDRFTSFYHDYYIPRKMTFVVTGDIKPSEVEARIKEAFATLENPSTAGSEPELGTIPENTGFRAAVFTDPEVASDDISLVRVSTPIVETDSVAVRLKKLPLALAHTMLNRRFSVLAKKEGSPIQNGSASRGVWFQAVEFGSIDVSALENRWQDAVAVLEQEFRRASEHGFTQSELTEAKANLLNAYEQAVEQEESAKSNDLAMQIINSINDLAVFSSPERNLEIMQEGLAQLTSETCHQAFQEFWNTPDLSLILTTNQDLDDSQEQLLKLYQKSITQPVDPPIEQSTADFAYTDFGAAGSILSETQVEDLAITQLVLSNQVRVNLKPTDFEKNSIRILARFGSGRLSMPQDQAGLDQLASALLNGGGLAQHSVDDLQRILAGMNVSAAFAISEDSMTLSGQTTAEDLTQQLQLMCAYLTEPGFRDEALRQYHNALPDRYDQLRHNLSGAQTQMSQWLHGNDARFSIPTLEQALSYPVDSVKEWVIPQIEGEYLELSIVGDFDSKIMKKELLSTFGALPARAPAPRHYPEARKLTFPQTPTEKDFTYQSEIPRAAAIVLWGIPGIGEQISRARRFNIASEILGDRMREKIREELGATYSPSTGSRPSDTFPEFGNLIAFSIAKPEDLEKINRITVELAADFAANGATKDELDRALNPTLSELSKTLRSNHYWLNIVMSRSQSEPYRLDWARQRDEDYASISIEDINALAKQYLQPENSIRVQLKPE